MTPKDMTHEEEQRIYTVKSYILNNLHEQFTIRNLARMAAMGEASFVSNFYKVFEITVGEYIKEARMKTGKLLLTHTSKPIKEIAALTGYRQARNFSTAYIKYFGESPKTTRLKQC